MEVATRNKSGVTVLVPKGKLIGGDEVFRDEVQRVVASGARKLLVDLWAVTAADEEGVNELVEAHMKMRRTGGKVKLVNLPSQVADVLQMTHMDTLFEVFENMDMALAPDAW